MAGVAARSGPWSIVKYGGFVVAAALVVTTLGVAGAAASHRRARAGVADFRDPAPLNLRRPVPTPAEGKTIRELAAGDEQTCALYTNGTVVCWGAEKPSYAADSRPPDTFVPRRIEGVWNAVALAVGDSHGCVLDADGRLSCWGYCDMACHAGNGPVLLTKATRVEIVPRLAAMAVDSFGDTTCGVGGEDEALHCWGEQSATVSWFGDPVGPRLYHFGPTDVSAPTGRYAPHAYAGAVELMSASSGVSCARFGDGRAHCFSEGMTNGEGKPFASLAAPREPVTRMGGNLAQGCFVLASGGVECHTTEGVTRPDLGPHARAVTVAAAGNSICATTEDGALVCQPHARAVEGRVRAVVSGTHHFCALREDDAVYCWDEYRDSSPERVALPPANAP